MSLGWVHAPVEVWTQTRSELKDNDVLFYPQGQMNQTMGMNTIYLLRIEIFLM